MPAALQALGLQVCQHGPETSETESMNRVSDLFEILTPSEIAHVVRRTSLAGLGVAVAAVVGFSVFGYWLIGVGAVLGLILGLLNIRLVATSMVRFTARGGDKLRNRIAGNTMLRLMVTTLIVFGLFLWVRNLGLGALGGTAVFYMLFISSVARSLFQQSAAA